MLCSLALSFQNFGTIFGVNATPCVIEDDRVILVDATSLASDEDRGSQSSQGFPSPIPPSHVDLAAISDQLQSLTIMVMSLSHPGLLLCPGPLPNSVVPMKHPPSDALPSPQLFLTLSCDDVIRLLHHKGAVLPLVCPCGTTISSNTKTNWSAKELHRMMGCRKICNYTHLIQVS